MASEAGFYFQNIAPKGDGNHFEFEVVLALVRIFKTLPRKGTENVVVAFLFPLLS